MRRDTSDQLSILHSELELLEAETFEITDNLTFDEAVMPASSSTTSTTSSCTSTSGCSCCN